MKKVLIFIFTSLCFLPFVVGAEMRAGQNGLAEIKTQASGTRAGAVIARCQIIESKIQIKAVNFDNNKMRHLEIYNQVKTKVSAIVEVLKNSGGNVDSLNSHLNTFDQKIQKFSSDYATYIQALKNTQVYACGKSEGEFMTGWRQAKTSLAQVHKDAVELRTFYATVLKPEINKVRAQIRANREANSTTTDTSAIMQTATSEIDSSQDAVESVSARLRYQSGAGAHR